MPRQTSRGNHTVVTASAVDFQNNSGKGIASKFRRSRKDGKNSARGRGDGCSTPDMVLPTMQIMIPSERMKEVQPRRSMSRPVGAPELPKQQRQAVTQPNTRLSKPSAPTRTSNVPTRRSSNFTNSRPRPTSKSAQITSPQHKIASPQHKIAPPVSNPSAMLFNGATPSVIKPLLDPATLRRQMAKGMQAPEGNVTVVFTDLQGSTTLWESNPPAMKAAVDLHDKIMRRCYMEHSGYEITTEGDAFQLAFQHPIDALAFALRTQIELHKADWSREIMQLEEASEKNGFRGFRVRMGMHHGPTKSRVHAVTGRTYYEGEAVEMAKAMEGMCHGGQILTTIETWMAVSGMSEQVLGSPQVMDAGEHELNIKSPDGRGFISKRVVQLVPKELSFDYFAARGREEHPGSDQVRRKRESEVWGRKFAPLKTKKKLSTSFVDAPYAGGKVTIVFVYTKGTADLPDNIKAGNLRIISKGVRSLLIQTNPPGYECQEENGSWMLAFGRVANAVSFSLRLVEALAHAPLKGDVDKSKMFKIGIHAGPFTSMGPHTVTGRADYFGPVVNRAARVASQCELGRIVLGVPVVQGETVCPPDFGSKIVTWRIGVRKLKGLTIDMALFGCARASQMRG
mmetsp:Transcript_12660/g.17448  ORF Transcript_12660/g.17448 Transcript_12660/m.17448 type:complete len:624 (-) Transcript_12660:298-2169(-)|eukprot:CAMPEP_0185723622 /NCGR_PEP_ID=MMETSP1171-20130828/406_1 /TAXON_ID=374046 /ORGANISM="Helicotheca tamensis, Strain CCMP826" /LENGTH=623 /DNA_ID=CAMNT_0028391357 /DNA_START=37 /DNA_END=1908 /DNA_ORIENTATION=-